jgi:hypothetical protein
MTQEQLDTLIEVWCLTAQESLGEYELVRYNSEWTTRCAIQIKHKDIENVSLPWEYIKNNYTPKEKAKIIISLLEQIRDNGADWLEQEKNYWQDRKENEEENNWESNRDYKD